MPAFPALATPASEVAVVVLTIANGGAMGVRISASSGVHAVLRRLHGHEVADAVAPVQPLGGRHLAAAG